MGIDADKTQTDKLKPNYIYTTYCYALGIKDNKYIDT